MIVGIEIVVIYWFFKSTSILFPFRNIGILTNALFPISIVLWILLRGRLPLVCHHSHVSTDPHYKSTPPPK
jgi:hypothetical protein